MWKEVKITVTNLCNHKPLLSHMFHSDMSVSILVSKMSAGMNNALISSEHHINKYCVRSSLTFTEILLQMSNYPTTNGSCVSVEFISVMVRFTLHCPNSVLQVLQHELHSVSEEKRMEFLRGQIFPEHHRPETQPEVEQLCSWRQTSVLNGCNPHGHTFYCFANH